MPLFIYLRSPKQGNIDKNARYTEGGAGASALHAFLRDSFGSVPPKGKTCFTRTQARHISQGEVRGASFRAWSYQYPVAHTSLFLIYVAFLLVFLYFLRRSQTQHNPTAGTGGGGLSRDGRNTPGVTNGGPIYRPISTVVCPPLSPPSPPDQGRQRRKK